MASEEKDFGNKAEELLLKLKSHLNSLKDKSIAQNMNFNDRSRMPTLLSLCLTKDCEMFEIQNQDNKEIKRKNLQAAEICLKVILIYLKSSKTIEAKKSVIHISLQSLHKAYSHCKDSEAYYGELFEDFTNELGSFYKLVQEVQKAAFQCLDDLINADSYDTDLELADIISVSWDVGKLCELISSLDRMISVVFWKIFIRLIFKYRNIAPKKIEVDSSVTALISDMKDIVDQCIYSIETKEQMEESDVKMCLIELSTLKKIVDVFRGYLKQNVIIQIRDLALQLFNLLILSHSNSVVNDKDMNMIKILLKTSKPIIANFFSENMFFTSAFRCSTEEVPTDLKLPLVLLKLLALDYLKTISDSKRLLQIEALKELFETLKGNKPENDLQLVSLKMQETPSKEVAEESTESSSLFQYCYTCLTEYCKHMRSNNVTELCENWLSSYTSSSDIVSLMISDVWVYYVRCGTIDNVYDSCKILSKALKESDSKARIELLLIRMLKFLPTNYKMKLFEEENHLIQILCSKNLVSRFGSSPMNFIPVDFESSEKIKLILKILEMPTSDDIQVLTQRACSILELGTLIMDKLTSAEMLKILEFANILLKVNAFDIQMAVLSLLRTLKGKTLSKNDKELDALTSVIAELLCKLMNCTKYTAKFDAFDVYFNLAQTTPHVEILKKVVIKCPDLTPFIKSFAEKVPSHGFLNEETKKIFFQKQLLYHQKSKPNLPLISDEEKSFLSRLFK